MNEEFYKEREAIEEKIKKEIDAFVNKYDTIKSLKVDVSFTTQLTKSGNFITPKVQLRVEI